MAPNDLITGLIMLGAIAFGFTNVAALLKDRGAVGVRPYADCFFLCNAMWQFANYIFLEQYFTALITTGAMALHISMIALIVYYRHQGASHASQKASPIAPAPAPAE